MCLLLRLLLYLQRKQLGLLAMKRLLLCFTTLKHRVQLCQLLLQLRLQTYAV